MNANVKKLLEKLPQNIIDHISALRDDYVADIYGLDGVRKRIAGYCQGLEDANVINALEHSILFHFLITPIETFLIMHEGCKAMVVEAKDAEIAYRSQKSWFADDGKTVVVNMRTKEAKIF